jgi:2-polyprenyl-3-methyl-5-hydroxy-6-metoxy-1,4-benzoquinol methylase
MLEHLKEHIDIFLCPACRGDLEVNHNRLSCKKCKVRYQIEDGIPLLFCPSEWDNSKKNVTDIVKEFYEKSPFPNYEQFDNIGALVQKSQNTFFANLLNKQIPFNIRVLEVGCGTGQMSNFLGVSHRYVFGTDMCLNSLKLGHGFKRKNNLDRVGFYQMNLFRPIFKEESFHLVICNGVLHHTGDPFGGFKSISKLVKKGGYILVGLYNTYGRLITDLRRIIFNISGDKFKYMDPRLRGQDRGESKKDSWFKDQYKNPHESKHTIGEVLRWFNQTNISFVYGIPNPKAFARFRMNDRIFKKHPKGSCFDHFIAQFRLFLAGSKEGGFFILIGKRIA